MPRKPNPVFNEKHLKALELIKRGGLSLDGVARQVGWKKDYIYDLYEGDVSKAGSVASLFSEEVKKFHKELDTQIKSTTKKNKAKANELVHRLLEELAEKDANGGLSLDDKKLVISLTKCITQSSPKVEIGSMSYSYQQGYTAEQLVYEFRRLKALAGGTSNRGSVQESFSARSGALPSPVGSGGEVEEEQ